MGNAPIRCRTGALRRRALIESAVPWRLAAFVRNAVLTRAAASRAVRRGTSVLDAHYLAMSFRLFNGRILMTRRAGLALNICSCFVNGLIPLRALTAGLFTIESFIRPGTTNIPGPFLPTAFLICPDSDSNTADTCLRDNSVSLAMFVMISLLVGPFAEVAAIDTSK